MRIRSNRGIAIGIALGLILVAGAALRLTGINWDQYQHLHPDERFLTMVETGIQMPDSIGQYFDTANSPLNPYNRNFGTFVYGTYPLFLAKLAGAVLAPFGNALVQHFVSPPAPNDFGAYGTIYQLLKDPGGYDGIHIIGRIFSGLSDILTVLLIYLIGRRLYGVRVGLLAAFFLAFSVLDIQQSHFFTVDTFANLPLVLALWFTLDIADGRGGWRSFILAGAFFGLALAARINLATFAAIITLAGGLRLIKSLEDVKFGHVVVPTMNGARTFEFASEAILGGDEPDAKESVHDEGAAPADLIDRSPTTRVVKFGPFSFELESGTKPAPSSPEDVETVEALAQNPPLPQRDGAEDTTFTRTAKFGPFSFELLPASPVAAREAVIGEMPSEAVKAEAAWTDHLWPVLVGLGLAAFAALLVFRVVQPYAFDGLGLNPKWVQDMLSLKDLLSGQADYPPSHQWTGRPDYWFTWINIVEWGLGWPLGLAATIGFVVAAFELVRKRHWQHLLIFFWVGGTFFYEGQQFVKTMRYSMPIYPFLALFGAYLIFWLWDRVGPGTAITGLFSRFRLGVLPRLVVAAVFLITVGYTLFWAVAFTSIYTRDVSRIAASHWIVHNIPTGSVIANEQWDDPLPLRVEGLDPFGNMFKGVPTSSDGELQMYGEDTPEKRVEMVKWLDATDYIVLSSNRLYLSIPRLPLRFPMTTKYYQWLFDGTLGFKLIKTFASYPQLLGITINDDSAEEAFSVYDHPKVLIFQKTSAYSHDKLVTLLNAIDLSEVYRQKPIDYDMSHGAFQLSPQDAAADLAGGTWSEIFNPSDLVNQIPVVVWVVLLEVLGILAFPITFAVFRAFADRGNAFAKAIGILLLGWGAWTLGSYHLVAFSRTSILLIFAAMIVIAMFAAWRQRRDLAAFVRGHIGLLLVEELVFFGFFAVFLLIRYGNPDLWHPYFGGEKPMDFAYLNAVIKTTWFPPYNPWFEGGYINYYYFGQLLSATLVRFTGILPEVAYNLLIPMFFALTALGAFGVAFNLVAGISSRELPTASGENQRGARFAFRAVVAGLLAALFVVVIGNLGEVGVLGDGLLKLGQPASNDLPVLGGALALLSGLISWLVERNLLPVATGNWYWTATRVIPDTINEFPFFTFLYADLHAHLMGLAFTLVALASGLHAVLIRGRLKWYDIGVFALVLGALRAINTWDYPTYLALIGGALVIGFFAVQTAPEEPSPDWGERFKRYLEFGAVALVQIMVVVIPTNAAGIKVTLDMLAYGLMLVFGIILGLIVFGGAFDPRGLARVLGWRFMAMVALSVALYFPFMESYGSAYTSVELWKDSRTSLTDYLVVHGIFLFMVATYLVLENLRKSRQTPGKGDQITDRTSNWLSEWVVYLLPGFCVFELVLIVLNLHVFAFVFPLVLLAAWLLLRSDTGPERRFIALLMVTALVMTLVVEVVTLKGDIGRMNTVFKFYLQGWVLFGIASAAGLTLMIDRMRPIRALAKGSQEPESPPNTSWTRQLKQAWWLALGILIFAGLLYPVFATWAKVNDRFVADSPSGLNGLDYMITATYNVNNRDLALIDDYKAIQWMRENIKGSPVIAEASYELYRWNDRVSINTGLPTIVGWDWHTKQQYSLIDGSIIDHRKEDVANLYNTPDPGEATLLIRQYHVSYVYVGPLERALYDPAGLSKFEAMSTSGLLGKVYDADGVQIYQVNAPANALVH